MHADDLRLRAFLAQRQRHAGDQPAAADGDQHGVEAWAVLDHFQCDRALTRDDVGVVERVHENQPARLLQIEGGVSRFIKRMSGEHDFSAEIAGLAHLNVRGRFRHDDGRVDAEGARVISKPLGVIAGRCGDDAFLTIRI